MDLKKVRFLLEKFYKGESTREEENILRDYFSNNFIDSEFRAEKDIFLYQIEEQENVKNIPDISNDIWKTISEDSKHKVLNKRNIIYTYLSIAASVIILLGSFFLLRNQIFNRQQDIHIVDTYDNPEIAYQEAREALLYVSSILNNGRDHLKPIAKMDKGTQELNKLSYINDGLKELDPISKYNLTDKFFKK